MTEFLPLNLESYEQQWVTAMDTFVYCWENGESWRLFLGESRITGLKNVILKIMNILS